MLGEASVGVLKIGFRHIRKNIVERSKAEARILSPVVVPITA
jgi:hypothetical protein